jgi:hypothetical protein
MMVFWLVRHFRPEEAGSMFFRNIDMHKRLHNSADHHQIFKAVRT